MLTVFTLEGAKEEDMFPFIVLVVSTLLLRVIGGRGGPVKQLDMVPARRACSDVRVNGICSLGKAAGAISSRWFRVSFPVLT